MGYLLALIAVLLLSGSPAKGKAATTATALSVTSGGQEVTSVSVGSVVTLTATVTSGGSAVTAGQVNFCDATAPHCTDVHLLASVQLTQNGTATFRLRPKAGSNSYEAVFVGTTKAETSASPVATLAVTGKTVTSTTLAQTGSPGNYTLTAEIGGATATAPTGTVKFLDMTDNNALLGTGTLGPGTTGLTFLNSSNSATGSVPIQIAIADFNGDGIPDLAILDAVATVTILLGNADGSFTASPTISHSQDNNSNAITAGDFNRDGNADLAIVNASNGTITVLLGNGDATFTAMPAISTSVGSTICCTTPTAIVTADFNHDGILDLVTSEGVVLLGNGDGTFNAALNLQGAGGGTSMAVGDFNGDGNLDVAMSNGAVFLGNGDGTFRAGTALPATGPIVAGDFNGDGNVDLAIANTPTSQSDGIIPTNMITILLGKGDGTFSVNATGPSTSNFPTAIAAGDFNGDGIADLAVSNYVLLQFAQGGTPDTTEITILPGDGKGNFLHATMALSEGFLYGNSEPPSALATGDFNGDGFADLAQPFWTETNAGPVNLVNVLLAEQSTATATVTGIAVPAATGTHNVVAQYADDTNNLPSTSTATTLQSLQGASTLTLALSPNPAGYGTAITFSGTASGSGLTPTGTVNFYNGNSQLGTGSLNASGVATYTTNAFITGSYSISATYTGDSNYSASTSATVNLTINKGVPTATLATSASAVLVGGPVTFTVTLTGGGVVPTGAVTFVDGTSTLGTATLGNGSANFTTSNLALGSHSITANYGGDGYYGPVTSAAVDVLVASTLTPTSTATTPAPVSPGGSASATLTLAAGPAYSGTMKLTCALTSSPSGAQSLPTCTLNPTSLTLAAGGTGTSMFTAKTTAATNGTAMLRLSEKFGNVVLAALLMMGLARRRRQIFATLALLLIFIAVVATGCGGGGSSTHATTAGTYTFTVTATDSTNSSITTTTKLTVTVQ